MTGLIKKSFLASFILLLGLFFTTKANAATLTNASDFISTSRPSAAAPLAADQLANAFSLQIVSLDTPLASNSPTFLASDSAVLFADTGQTISTGAIIASESAVDKPSANKQILYFTAAIANSHHNGTTIIVPVTATHTINFKTVTAVPGSGHIIITFPAGGSIASPSATGFSFNGIATSNPTDIKFNNATCTSVTLSANNGTIDCLLNASGIGANTTVTVLIGCTAGTTSCTTFAPRLINPTKGASSAGTADIWRLTLQTQDNNGIVLDNASIKIATVEAVTVQGIVEPYLTFTISGTSGSVCGDTTNSGTASTATFVDLGSLGPGLISIAAQNLTVNTNATNGYAITATSSGHLINPGSGVFLPDANTGNNGNGLSAVDTPAPAAITASIPAFGIHPCGTSGTPTPTVSSGTWGTGGGASNKYSNPWNTGVNGFYANISSTSVAAASSVTTVEYAAAVSQTFPSGTYFNYFTYVATPTF